MGSSAKKGKGKKAKQGGGDKQPPAQKLNHSLDIIDAFDTLKVAFFAQFWLSRPFIATSTSFARNKMSLTKCLGFEFKGFIFLSICLQMVMCLYAVSVYFASCCFVGHKAFTG